MSTEQETAQEGAPTVGGGDGVQQPKLRRRPFGFSKRDVREALERQSAELGAREAELAELRQDIAALWLAFAQHDRMIRHALGEESPQPAAAKGRPAADAPAGPMEPSPARPEPPASASPAAPAATDPAAEDDAAIGRQLSDLDDVLAAIELATQTLERTYVGDAARRPEEPKTDPPAAGGKPSET